MSGTLFRNSGTSGFYSVNRKNFRVSLRNPEKYQFPIISGFRYVNWRNFLVPFREPETSRIINIGKCLNSVIRKDECIHKLLLVNHETLTNYFLFFKRLIAIGLASPPPPPSVFVPYGMK